MIAKKDVSQDHASDASVHMDAIRGLAALTVFLGHGRGLFLQSGLHDALKGSTVSRQDHASVPPSFVDGTRFALKHTTVGQEAVVIFFVLSGYFVGGSVLRSARRGSFRWTKYLFQRLTRLWVALIPALLLGWALDAGGMHFFHSHQNLYSGPAGQSEVGPGLAERVTPIILLANVAFLQNIFFPLFGTNASLWSLSYEFWYYIFFPLLVTACIATKRTWVRILSALLMLVAMTMCGWTISAYFLLWLFGAGVAMLPLAVAPRYRRISTVLAALLLFAALPLELKYSVNLYMSDLVLGLVFSLFLWTILHARGVTTGRLYRGAAQHLSSMSYTLYLVHMPCFAFISAALFPVWSRWPLSFRSAGMLLGIYAVVFAVCWLVYFCFERNTERIRNRIATLALRRT